MTEETSVKRIHAHLLINDTSSACNEARLALQTFPDCKSLWEAYIKALAKAGNEKEMITAWKTYASTYDPEYKNRDLTEAIAWGIIYTGTQSSSPITRIHALLGAFFSQDSKGVDILYRYMSDCNSLLRHAAVQLSSRLRDAKLCEAMLRLFREEKVWAVRLEVIKSIGEMRLLAAKPELTAIIANDKSSSEEKSAAIHSLVTLLDSIDKEEVARLASSNRAGLRLMACEMVVHFFQTESFEYIFPLLHDHCSAVRMAALQVLGTLRIRDYQGKPSSELAAEMLSDPDPMVAITAAWVLTLNDPVRGQQALRPWLTHKTPSLRIHAAAALSYCGKYGFPLALETFQETTDFYVRMNLALALIGQRVEVEQACEVLCSGLIENKERWTWSNHGLFRALAPSYQKHQDSMGGHSEAKNQLVRLEILNQIAIMQYAKAQDALVNFLQQKNWSLTGMTAALLLTEGDEAALDLVQNLVLDNSHQVKVQAALILALWGREEGAIATLQQAYAGSERELKEKIIEGIGRVGAKSSIPFLIEKLQEPSPTLRLLAAAALLQCLYH
jgi:HEAT repeat protein